MTNDWTDLTQCRVQ